MTALTASAPASSANLGPGFDALALALNLRNTVQVDFDAADRTISVVGEGSEVLPLDESHLTARAMALAFEAAGTKLGGYRMVCHNHIPLGSGLGSTAAAVVAGLVVANGRLGNAIAPDDLLRLAVQLEGHADNAAACLIGGLALAFESEQGWLARSLPVADLKVAVVVPQVDRPTAEMRRLLPDQVSLRDAAHNLSRLAVLLDGLRTGDPSSLSLAMSDRLHEPHRYPHIPAAQAARRAGLEVGAAAVALSGAGPSLIAFASSGHAAIAAAMADAFRQASVRCRTLILGVDRDGARLST
jgi:homoserine kinase